LIGLDSIEYGGAMMFVLAGYEVKAVELRRDVVDRFVKEGGISASHRADKQCVTYKPNIWHHGLAVLDSPAASPSSCGATVPRATRSSCRSSLSP
jgi:hypothetical protein